MYGGNTTCIYVKSIAGANVILDAGTGIRVLGDDLLQEKQHEFHILFTHTHWDHIQGFPFFAPIYDKTCKVNIYFRKGGNIKSVLETLFNQLFHPISLEQLSAQISFIEFDTEVGFAIDCDVAVTTVQTNHPDGNVAYRLDDGEMSFVFTGDHEGKLSDYPKLSALMAGADAAAVDGMYSIHEYQSKRHWGHSDYAMWLEDAAKIGIKRLFFTHHNPASSDEMLDDSMIYLKHTYEISGMRYYMAREGYLITKNSYSATANVTDPSVLLQSMRKFSSSTSKYKDIGAILDNILLEARKLARADAGTIYLMENDKLVFSYVHNDTLFTAGSINKFIYSSAELAINESTIAGYAAYHKKTVMVDDVYNIPSDRPYKFNPAFDNASGYRTHSMLAVPILAEDMKLMGIIQLINSKNKRGDIVPFRQQNKVFLEMLAMQANTELSRGLMARAIILRILSLTTMRDAKENKGHFLRVGAYAAAIFHRWAENKNMDIDRLKFLKDQISIAAMLHDVGKVGIADGILSKPGKLTDEEFALMTRHAFLGAVVFENANDGLEEMCGTIAHHHHQKWNGKGYTGNGDETPLAGEDIPWAARITAIADVFDALTSKRVYKDAWSFEESVDTIRKDSGSHFDPDMVDAFLEIQDTIKAIFEKYKNI
jgi:HD-GYP domain-containing protein (c-di-GMP phosphodiesterase class II)/phosphoribosyl 1,2-cyclic phosphodiesterase